jgi:hypothetical protein
MPKEKKWLRRSSVSFALQNDSNVVYLYDESNRRAINEGEFGRLGPDAFTQAPEVLEDLAHQGMLQVIDVEKGALLRGEIASGPAPKREELKAFRWRKRQVGLIRLPTGKLCMETANSQRIGPEDYQTGEDEGLVLRVAPGEYTLTWYEVAYEALSDEQINEGTGPRNFVTLTPRGQTPKSAPVVQTQAAPAIAPSTPRSIRPVVKGRVFHGAVQANEFLGMANGRSDLDRAAARKMRLGYGMRLQIDAGGRRVEAVYLGDLGATRYLRVRGQLTAGYAGPGGRPTDAHWVGTEWQSDLHDPEKEVLCFWGNTGWDDLEDWTPATISVLPMSGRGETYSPGRCTLKQGEATCEVLSSSAEILTLAVSPDVIKTLGVKPAGKLLMTAGKEERLLLCCADEDDMERQREQFNQPSEEEREKLDKLSDQLVRALSKKRGKQSKGDVAKRQTEEQIRKLLMPAGGDKLPLAGYLYPHWLAPKSYVLWVEPLRRQFATVSVLDIDLAAIKPGASVRLRKASKAEDGR